MQKKDPAYDPYGTVELAESKKNGESSYIHQRMLFVNLRVRCERTDRRRAPDSVLKREAIKFFDSEYGDNFRRVKSKKKGDLTR